MSEQNKQPTVSQEERQLPEFNAMQAVKRRFFAMRNGDLAAQMAERGARYRINFGLNLPQIKEIARDFLPGGAEAERFPSDFDRADFARRLRDNVTTRESRLIAPMLFPVEQLTDDEALAWARSVDVAEVADILCFSLLRNFAGAAGIAEVLSSPEATDMERYTGLRLSLNLLMLNRLEPAVALQRSEVEQKRGCALTASVCRQLNEEAAFRAETDF